VTITCWRLEPSRQNTRTSCWRSLHPCANRNSPRPWPCQALTIGGTCYGITQSGTARGAPPRKEPLVAVLLTLCVALPLAALQTTTPQKKSPPIALLLRKTRARPQPLQIRSRRKKHTSSNSPARQFHLRQPTPPIGGVIDGVPGGVRGGVIGGVSGGIRAVPAMPSVPAPPQAVPVTSAGLAIPRRLCGQAADRPASPRSPHATPVPPAAPPSESLLILRLHPSLRGSFHTVTGWGCVPAPRPFLCHTLPLRSLRYLRYGAQLAAIHAQAAVNPAEVEALRAKIAALATTPSAASMLRWPRFGTDSGSRNQSANCFDITAGHSTPSPDCLLGPSCCAGHDASATQGGCSSAQLAAMPRIASTPLLHAADMSAFCAGDGSHPTVWRSNNDGSTSDGLQIGRPELPC